jgi:hypothetical protein
VGDPFEISTVRREVRFSLSLYSPNLVFVFLIRILSLFVITVKQLMCFNATIKLAVPHLVVINSQQHSLLVHLA